MAFSSPFMAKSPFNQKEEKNKITGNTQSEQNEKNKKEKKKQVVNSVSYENFQIARAAKKTWEDESPDNFLKDYPKQKELDSLRSVYKNKPE